eukprot:scaffold11535_cov135-Isochrysis_galbana.AAC.2
MLCVVLGRIDLCSVCFGLPEGFYPEKGGVEISHCWVEMVVGAWWCLVGGVSSGRAFILRRVELRIQLLGAMVVGAWWCLVRAYRGVGSARACWPEGGVLEVLRQRFGHPTPQLPLHPHV